MFNKKTLALSIFLTISFLVFATSSEARLRSRKIHKVAKEIEKTSVDNTYYFEESFPRDDEIKMNERRTGSLWVDSYNSRLYNNLHRASQVGDMVTIMIEETAQGSKTAETKLDRKSKHLFGVSGLFGLVGQLTSAVTGITPSNMVDTQHNAKHDGKGETKRKGELHAALTARVVRVMKNGDMQIRGQKNIKVNGEEQTLLLEGFIRPYDINSDNTILSNYIADARITFNGFGVVADQQKPGWLSSILQKILPF